MTDDFESELRETLGNAVPTPPETQSWAAGARAYTHRVRRTRAVIAVGAVAVVAAAVVVIPNVMAGGDNHVAGPSDSTSSTKSPLPVPPLAHPFTCAMAGEIDNESPIPNGVVPSGAVLARICPIKDGNSHWSAPREPLVIDVGGLVEQLNALPVWPGTDCPAGSLEGGGVAFSITFQYADGHTVSSLGSTVGCKFVATGSVEREGAETLVRDYLNRLHDQRARFAPPQTQIAAPTCPVYPAAEQAVLVDGRNPGLTQAIACTFTVPGGSHSGVLTPSQIREVEADLRTNATTQRPKVSQSCNLRGPSTTLVISGSNAWGDDVTLVDGCNGVSFIDGSGTWYWTPSAQTMDMLKSVQHVVPADGQIVGRLMAIGGPFGTGPRPLAGELTIQGRVDSILVTVHRDGSFSRRLPPGRYSIVGHSPSYNDGNSECRPIHRVVTVRAHHATRLWVLCQEK